MDVAKRLDFDHTLTGGLQDAHQRFQTANTAALTELQQAVQDLAGAAKQKQAQILSLACQTAEQGVGDNDLKRLQRQFDSNKANLVNIDQKQRFMRGLYELELDLEQLTALKAEHEQQLEREADALRGLKAQNEQAREKLGSTGASIAHLYSSVEQVTAATAEQLDATRAALQQHAAAPPAHDAPLEPGPGLVEAQQLVEDETAQAKELERSIAAAEALLSDLEVKAAAAKQELTGLKAEVSRMESLAGDRAKATDADKQRLSEVAWCHGLEALVANLGGRAVVDATPEQLELGLSVSVPTSRSTGAPLRTIEHRLLLQRAPLLAAAKLSPSCIDISDLLQRAQGMAQPSRRVEFLVGEVHKRLLRYWRRQALVEAAAEVYPPGNSSRGPPHIKASLPQQVEAEVLVPLDWPSEPGEVMRLTALSAPELGDDAAARLLEVLNGETELLARADLAGWLSHVARAVEAAVLDAAAGGGA